MNEKIRPKGKWIKKSDWSHVCSLCGCDMMDEYNYCPDCGAEMEQADERIGIEK